jgi:ketosteroid isomerase-like protein
MVKRLACRLVPVALLVAWAGLASAQTWTPEQQELWKLEEQQWQMSRDKDLTWVDKMVHPNLSFWETGQPMPRNRASLARWNKFTTSTDSVLEQELFPISITVTGNVAVVQYYYLIARENYKKERATVHGHYMDVFTKDGGTWKFIAWAGGDDPQK